MKTPIRVLIVEDSVADTELVVAELRSHGYDPAYERVETPEAMRAALDRQPWDVVIADYTLPRFSAPDALEVLKESGLDVPFIICSGSVRDAAAVEAINMGADDYVMKGNLARLVPAIEREIGGVLGRQAHRRLEASLRETEALKGAILEATLDSIITMDNEGKVVEVNPAAEKMFGYQRVDVLGTELADLIIPPSLREKHRGGMAGYLAPDKCPALGKMTEMTAQRADGSEFPVELAVVRVARNGSPVFTVYIRDLTERKQLEAHMFQVQKMEAIGQLAGGIAHHFNNIMGGVMGFSDLLLKRLEANDPLHEYAEKIKNGALRAASLTQQLLVYSRNEPRQVRELDLNTVLTLLHKTVDSLIGDKIRVGSFPEKDIWKVKTDPVQIEQIIIHLATNACDAMPDGGALTFETANVTLDAEYAHQHADVAPGEYVLLAVHDTGCGLTDEAKAHLFEPFFTTKPLNHGTGLGLATCYGIAKQSGGHIDVQSKPSQGTTVRVYLPRWVESARLHPTPAQTKGMPKGLETVLVAEDETELRELASQSLRELGYHVLEAADGEEALLIMQERKDGPIDILLTDGRMPRMGGKQLAEHFHAFYPQAKLLYISGLPADGTDMNGQPAGAQSLPKPFSLTELSHKVRDMLDEVTVGRA